MSNENSTSYIKKNAKKMLKAIVVEGNAILNKMKLILLLGAICQIANCQFENVLAQFEYLYDVTSQEYGQDYMEGIKFTRETYNFTAIDGEEFDFVVVGAGPSGSALAHRLSENKNFKVLLLEAGDVAPVTNDIPYFASMWNMDEKLIWDYRMEKDKHYGWGLKDGTIFSPRGKALGGTSVLNYMLHTRGNKGDFDALEKLGLDQWSWENIEPVIKGLENVQIERQDFDERGHWGPVFIGEISQRTEVANAFVEACQKNGLPYVDFNGKSQIGISYAQATVLNGFRQNAEKVYLRSIKKRPNVKILTRSVVKRVNLDSNNVATGVVYSRDGQKYTATATKEVILSAGVYNSPQLLMLSGIGPQKELEKHGIAVIKDLPVGKTVKDHLTFFGCVFEVDEPITLVAPTSIDYHEIIQTGKGILAHGYVETMGFYQTESSNKEELNGRPDIELFTFPADFSIDGGAFLKESWGFSQSFYDDFFKQHEGKNVFTVLQVLLQPEATGRLRIQSANINDAPVMRYPFLNNKQDVTAMIEAINRSIAICNEEPLAKYGCRPVSTVFPKCTSFVFHSDKYWECALRTLSSTLHHQTGTCRMGTIDDPLAVVDQEGKVYGISNLRVADVSIFPYTVSAHTMAPAYMVGEKIALDLKKKYIIHNIPDTTPEG